ncbi:hypothetical protein FoTM2_009281 [Fusarium oxysporum f. sp. vasinfectum]|nr:hypothetical protein FoTM2_009281 [Fusarium oxysporum f. sp. vasinfectum]
MNLFTAQLLIISAFLSGVAQAESNSTASNTNMVGWVAPAPRRSTWSIIWSCLSIFVVCSWKCVHLNIPTHEEIQAPLRRKWSRKIIWMTVIALAPEFGVALAAKQYMDARRELKEFTKALSNEVAQKYTMAHAFYVQMGGIIIYETSAESSIIGEDSARNLRSSNGVSIVAHRDPEVLQLSQGSGSNRHGAPKMTRSLIEVQPDIFRIPESEIKDQSKADVITKAFAITQCTWLIVQCISRVAHGYSISLLELATLAFIFCAFIMHIF